MIEDARPAGAPGDFVEFWPAGAAVEGEFQCSECGYGVSLHRTLPLCPMCGGDSWEQPQVSAATAPRRGRRST